jgi:hypothetical protein
MHRRIVCSCYGKSFFERRILKETAGFNGIGDPRNVCFDDAPRAEIQVTDFRIARRVRRQTDARPGSGQIRFRIFRRNLVIKRRVRERDGVAFALRRITPAVENDERQRSFFVVSVVHNSSEAEAPISKLNREHFNFRPF